MDASRLRAVLDEALQREAKFRLENAEDFLDLQARLRQQAKTIAERDAYIHQLHLERTERDARIHQLHLGQIADRERIQAAFGDVEAFVWKLHHAEAKAAREREKRSLARRLLVFFGMRPKRSAGAGRAGSDLPAGDFLYHFHPSPYRLYRGERVLLRGWVLPKDGRPISAVRARMNGQEFPARCGLDEPEVVARHGPQPANPRPGFEIDLPTPPGTHWLRIEARLDNSEWRSILNLPIWCQPS